MPLEIDDLNLCIYSSHCNQIIVEDNSEWVVTDEITSVTIIVTNSAGDTVTKTFEGETLPDNDTYTLDEEDLADFLSGDIITDGFYTIYVEIVYIDTTDGDQEYALEYDKDWQSDCNLKCKIDKLVMSSLDADCADCEDKDWDAIYEIHLRYQIYCKALSCGDLDYAQEIFDNLNELLINFNCKNC